MLRLLLVGGILSVGLVASLWSRFAALLTYVWFAVFRPQEWLWTSAVEQLRLSLVVAVLLVVPSLLTGVFPNVTHPLSLLTLAFLGVVGIAQSTTVWHAWSWPWVDAFMRLVLVVLLAITIVNTRRRALIFMAVLAGSLGFHTARGGLTAILTGGVRFAQGLGGAFTDNNGYALAAAMILPLLWCVSQNLDKTKPIERFASWGFAVSVPLSILLVIGTMSRSGFLAVATSVLVYLLLQKRKIMPLLVVTATLAIALPFLPMPEGYFDRLQTIRTYEEANEASALSRLHFWQVALRMVADNPLGVGLRNFDHAYDQYDFLAGEFGFGRSVHSSHFQALAEMGYLGAALWILLFVYAFIVAFRVRRFGGRSGLAPDEARFYTTTGNALIVSMTAFLVGGAFIALVNNDLTWYTFGIVAAVDRIARARQKELEPPLPRVSTEIALPPRRRATA
jgi:putative inorganic carbon (HCO3(-)) transporter